MFLYLHHCISSLLRFLSDFLACHDFRVNCSSLLLRSLNLFSLGCITILFSFYLWFYLHSAVSYLISFCIFHDLFPILLSDSVAVLAWYNSRVASSIFLSTFLCFCKVVEHVFLDFFLFFYFCFHSKKFLVILSFSKLCSTSIRAELISSFPQLLLIHHVSWSIVSYLPTQFSACDSLFPFSIFFLFLFFFFYFILFLYVFWAVDPLLFYLCVSFSSCLFFHHPILE